MDKEIDKITENGQEAFFSVENGTLRANGDMYWEYLEEFDAACRKALAGRRSRIEIDLTAVNFISSSFLGCLGNLTLGASRMKKRILLRVSLDTSWLFDIMDARGSMDVEIV